MASYQIPQFLDSGDKIIGPLNMRQFGYALGGFMICALIFTTVSSALPGIGVYAAIFCAPIAALTLYLAFGKFNGRDSEIYILKFIIFNSKPKQMVYTRVPEVADLDDRMAEWSSDKIAKRWSDAVSNQKALDGNEYLSFTSNASDQKARKIRQLGDNIDMTVTNSMAEVQRRQMEIEQKEQMLRALQQAQGLARKK